MQWLSCNASIEGVFCAIVEADWAPAGDPSCSSSEDGLNCSGPGGGFFISRQSFQVR
jgi:hypothetical protein